MVSTVKFIHLIIRQASIRHQGAGDGKSGTDNNFVSGGFDEFKRVGGIHVIYVVTVCCVFIVVAGWLKLPAAMNRRDTPCLRVTRVTVAV